MVGLQNRLRRYFTLCNQGFDFNKYIRQVKRTMAELSEIKNKRIILQSRERKIEEGENAQVISFVK